jgi:hypothetical protein
MLTGLEPREHGIVGNGWYFRDLNEILFWRQSNRLVHGRKVWEEFRGKTASLFWWFNMATTGWFNMATTPAGPNPAAPGPLTVTPRPAYFADGRKLPDVYSDPPEIGRELQRRHGPFPLFRFWGPLAGIESTRWIASAAIDVIRERDPDLTLVYLPHLDYDLQRKGPDGAEDQVRAVDAEAARILDAAPGHKALVVSEYGITRVAGALHPNHALREAGLLEVIDSPVGELLDPARSRAFAVCDHQVAHVYATDVAAARRALEGFGEFAEIAHPRAGDLVLVAPKDRWFAYPYWLDDAKAPDFARTVDIHRKPGYDPCELFCAKSRAAIAWALLRRKLGFRGLLETTPLDASLVKGSHGRLPDDPAEGPLMIGDGDRPRAMAEVKAAILTKLAES